MKITLKADMTNGLAIPDAMIRPFAKMLVADVKLSGGEVELIVGSGTLVDGIRLVALQENIAECLVIVDPQGKEWPTSKYGTNNMLTQTRVCDVSLDILTDLLLLQSKRRQVKNLVTPRK